MSKGRMEAFSDGVVAILITIMVLVVAILWLIPDPRIERELRRAGP